jgi:hypothetical protein
MPIGLGTVQSANTQIVETEIFNRIWLEVNTIRFYSLPTYQRMKAGVYPDGVSTNPNGLTYFDKDGGEINPNTPQATAPAGSVYYVYCALINPSASATANLPSDLPSNTLSRLPSLGPPVDGLGTSTNPTTSTSPGGSGLNLVQVQIGFHFDPSTLKNPGQTDPRVTSRTFVIAKRDTSNGS